MRSRTRGILAAVTALTICLCCVPACLATDTDAAWAEALAGCKSPAQKAFESGILEMRTGESAPFPSPSQTVTPFDERPEDFPAFEGEFASTDESVVTVSENGLITALAAGMAQVIHYSPSGETSLLVSVSMEHMPQLAANMAYVAQREFYSNKRARLPKYNKYAKWYYGKRKEVGWCSVFTIWCANAAGGDPVKKSPLPELSDEDVVFLKEGQVGNQYDGFFKLDRFTGIPRPGYLVIYADLSNSYRTVHVGIVVDALDMGGGVYRVTTVEGNMSNTVKSYCYLYDSNLDNSTVGVEKGRKLADNMRQVPEEERESPLVQYTLHTDHWAVFGFCQTWK